MIFLFFYISCAQNLQNNHFNSIFRSENFRVLHNGFSNFRSADHQIVFSPHPRPAVREPSAPPTSRHWAGRHQLDQQHPARSGAQQQQGRLATGRGVASGGATEGGRPAARISEAISTSLLQINQQPWRRARTPSSGCTPTTSMIWIHFSEPL